MYQELKASQSREFIDSAQVFEAWVAAKGKRLQLQGGMHWKTVAGIDYLYKTSGRRGNAKSLGARSAETETIYADFQRGKSEAEDRYKSLTAALNERARFCRAARINRVPRVVTGILRQLDEVGLLGASLCVVGTNALYAYEAAGGVQFDSSLLATADVDLLWDARSKLSLAASGVIGDKGLIDLLKRVDPSFEAIKKDGFRASNKDGYLVDLIKPEPSPIWKKEATKLSQGDDLVAAEIANLQWLQSSPRFAHVVIGDDGVPAPMVVPDPRAFSVYKIWLSSQPRREPVKRERDRLQGLAVTQLVRERITYLPFENEDLKAFPKEVVDAFRIEAASIFDKQAPSALEP